MSRIQKPRLEPAPLTHEDLEAWSYCYGFVEGEAWDEHMIAARIADRRDAELMLVCRHARAACIWEGLQHCLVAWEGVAVPGFDDWNESLNEKGLAVLLPRLNITVCT